MADEFTLGGFDEIIRGLEKVDHSVLSHLEEVVDTGAEIIREDAGKRVHNVSGSESLSENIITETAEKTARSVVKKIGPQKDKFYGRFLEYGTSKMSPRPFLRPALDEKGQHAEKAMANKLRELMRRV